MPAWLVPAIGALVGGISAYQQRKALRPLRRSLERQAREGMLPEEYAERVRRFKSQAHSTLATIAHRLAQTGAPSPQTLATAYARTNAAIAGGLAALEKLNVEMQRQARRALAELQAQIAANDLASVLGGALFGAYTQGLFRPAAAGPSLSLTATGTGLEPPVILREVPGLGLTSPFGY